MFSFPGALLVLAAALLPASVVAQRPDQFSRRDLTTLADTNVSDGYIQYGKQVLWKNPAKAAAAFHWAGRIDPVSTAALYGERVAILAQLREDILDYYLHTTSKKILTRLRVADSLMERVLQIDPLLHRALEEELISRAAMAMAARNIQVQGGEPDPAALRYWIRQDLDNTSPALAGWVAYSRGDFQAAASQWALALRKDPESSYLWAERGRVFALMQQYDSSRAHLLKAISFAQPSDSFVRVYYESKAPLLYTLGFVNESGGDFASARENYEAALVEDLGYSAPHVRLGMLALQQKDTAKALIEFDRAVAVNSDDFTALLTAGYVYAAIPKYAEAAQHLRQAAALEPFAPAVQFLAAQVLEANGEHAAAAQHYMQFLRVAPADSPARGQAERRVAALTDPSRHD